MLFFLFAQESIAQDYSNPVSEGEVIIEKSTDLVGGYRDRRSRYGMIFSVNYEKYSPDEYLSLIQNKKFSEISGGDAIPVIGGELGVKFNFAAGSLTGVIGYGGGTYKNAANKIEKMSINISKISANFALDSLMSEPWVVPYGQIGASQFNWSEESYDTTDALKEESFVTDWNLNYKIGLMFQLNWIEDSIDSNTHRNGLMSSGLQNTFLDLFYSSYSEPTQVATADGETGDANLGSENFGVGLKLEF
jgi:hypothetical protein